MTIPPPTNVYCLNIARRADGLHAFAAAGGLYTWKNAGEVTHANIPPFIHSSPSCDFCGDKLIIADIGVGVGINGPMKIAELDLGTMTFSATIEVGNSSNREPVVRGLPSGGCVVVSYTMDDTHAFDISYRSPFTGEWATQRHNFSPGGFIPASRWEVVCGTDGLIYVFGIHDGSARLMMFRFGEGLEGLFLVDEDTSYIHGSPHNGVYDPMAPMGELPWLHARTDAARGRIVIAYQKWPYSWECGVIRSFTQIVAIYPDKSRELVGDIEEWSGHGNPAYLFPRPDGVYYALTHGPKECGETFERFRFGGFTKKGHVYSAQNPPCKPFMSCSDDGWVMRMILNPEDWTYTPELLKMGLPPQLWLKSNYSMVKVIPGVAGTAAPEGYAFALNSEIVPAPFVEVSWDQQTSADVLEGSNDLINWAAVYTGPPPVIFNKDGPYKFFQVRAAGD